MSLAVGVRVMAGEGELSAEEAAAEVRLHLVGGHRILSVAKVGDLSLPVAARAVSRLRSGRPRKVRRWLKRNLA